MSIPTTSARPTDEDARRAIARYLGNEPFSFKRFSTGLCHYVYDVSPKNQIPFVLRMGHSETRNHLIGSVYWTEKLLPLDIPIPKILHKDLSGPFPYTILQRFPGKDLWEVYASLSNKQLQCLVQEIVHWQGETAKLPAANRFGFGFNYEDARMKSSWAEVIESQIRRAHDWIVGNAICSIIHVARVEKAFIDFRPYLESKLAIPFLHDTTTKNVLISDGKFSGIVDIDDLCFGDSLYVVALTRMALLSGGYNTDYIKFWCDELKLTKEELKILDFYTAIFCVTFMGELGQKFNRDAADVDPIRLKRLEEILDSLFE